MRVGIIGFPKGAPPPEWVQILRELEGAPS